MWRCAESLLHAVRNTLRGCTGMNIEKMAHRLAKQYRVTHGKGFRLKDFDPEDTGDLKGEKDEAGELLEQSVKLMGELQDKLYAQDRWALLLIFQAMDAAGKDGTIKHV